MGSKRQLLHHWTSTPEGDPVNTNTVEMTKGADTIYVPREQENYFKARGYSAATAKTVPADTKTKETTR